jgi:hypothetical protein
VSREYNVKTEVIVLLMDVNSYAGNTVYLDVYAGGSVLSVHVV